MSLIELILHIYLLTQFCADHSLSKSIDGWNHCTIGYDVVVESLKI